MHRAVEHLAAAAQPAVERRLLPLCAAAAVMADLWHGPAPQQRQVLQDLMRGAAEGASRVSVMCEYYVSFTVAVTALPWCNLQRVMWCDVMWCDVMWCDVMWCDVMW
jgi:hypothetical protein